MGNQAIILALGVLLLVGIFTTTLLQRQNDLAENSGAAYAEQTAKENNDAAMELALRTLADSSRWRSSLSNLAIGGGTSTVTFKDTVFGTDSAVVVRGVSTLSIGTDSGVALTIAIVKPSPGFVPRVIRGAFTAFDTLDDVISDMTLDGRNWQYDLSTFSSKTGVYAVSTGQPVFINTQNAKLGGTTYLTSPAIDITPAFPYNPLVVETNSPWPGGWPTTPDAALGFPEGTLKNIAVNKLVPGSQYITKYSDLKFPLRGVTFLEVPNLTIIKKQKIGVNPEGIFVLHSPGTDALWDDIQTTSGPFKGLMIMDNVFHIHMDILGGLVALTPQLVQGKVCNGNAGHWIRYSSEAIQISTQLPNLLVDASWKNRLKVLSWFE